MKHSPKLLHILIYIGSTKNKGEISSSILSYCNGIKLDSNSKETTQTHGKCTAHFCMNSGSFEKN
jgi:hypothetical protein